MLNKLLSSRGPAARCRAWLLGAGLLLAGPVAHAQTPLAGTYTINSAQPTGGTNFSSFSDAATRLNTDGISAPVTISVSGGPYTEQLLLNQLTGSSATNTLVINGNGSVIQFAPNAAAQRAVVQLNGTDYTTLNNLVITCQAATYGYGILLTNVADNNRLTNNVINTDLASTSSNFAGIVTSGGAALNTAGVSANSLLIEGNTINGGYYGINLYGNTTAAPNTGIVVRNNQVKDFYINGIYLGFQEGTQIIGNDVSRPTRSVVGGFNGIWAFGTSRGVAIEKNRLHDPFTGSPASTGTSQPIFLATGTGATATQTNDVVNNVVYNMNGNGIQYAVYNSASAYLRVYNNSFSLDDQTSTSTLTTYGVYTNGANNDVRNNVISVTRTGTGPKYALYYTIAGTISNYNDLYAPTGNVGYFTTAYATLAAWQAANGGAFDQNSLSVNPQYTAPTTGGLQPGNLALNNVGQSLARVTDDIMGTPRSATPDPGAYEFANASITVDLAAAALLAPAAGTACYSATETVTVQVRNAGTAPLNFALNPATVTVVVTPPGGGAAQTLTATLATGTLAAGATQSVTLPSTANLTAAGTYSFAVTATVTGDQNPGNNTLTPSPTRAVLAPVGGTLTPGTFAFCGSGTGTLQVSGTANGTLQYQSSPDGLTFADIAGATSASYTTPALTSTTYYRVRVGCNSTTVAYSNVAVVTVRNPQVATTNGPLTICAGTTATLTATAAGSGQVRFFAAATGGPALASAPAGSYTTPALTASTTYYAEATESSPETVGKASTTGLDGTDTAAGGLYFTATGPTTITSVTVYRAANAPAGTATVYLLVNSSTSLGNALTSAVVPVPANTSASVAPAVLTLNFAVPSAGNYTLFLSAATPALVRDNTTATPATAFPYSAPSGLVSITGTTLAPYYYYFYNWQIAGQCLSASRTPIQVNVTTPPTTTLTAATQPSGAVQLTATPLSGATYQFFRNGVAVSPASTTNTLTLLSGAQNGSYTVTVTVATGCAPLPPTAVSVTVLGTHAASLAGISLHLFPNPTPDGTLTLELTGPRATAAQLTVLGALGQEVYRGPLAAGTSALHLPHLAPGMYTLRLQTPEGVLTQRFVRE